MLNEDALPAGEDALPAGKAAMSRGLAARRDAWLLATLARSLPDLATGSLRLRLPSGTSAVLGPGQGVEADLDVKSFALVRRAMLRGTVGFAESYINREIETSNLANVFRFFLANFERLDRAGGGWFKVRSPDRLAHRRRANTRKGSRRNIAAHYDLGNGFYRRWLDDGMTYSSGIFADGAATLEEAQDAKYAAIADALDVKPGMRVLEIGCGWGGMAETLARRGAHVTALTLSREQLAYARERLAAAGLADRVEVRLEDYRDVTGTFDRIVSVEMIEAVGEENWPAYFATLRDRLHPGGSAVLQAITIREESFETYRRHPDFIQRYIFPGGMLPTKALMEEHAREAGCAFAQLRTFGACYARTLALWREQFSANWPAIRELGFDDRFRRMWLYYLVYCEVGFDDGLIDVGLYRVARPD